MKSVPSSDLANDNGKPEQHLVAATLALREAIKGQADAEKMAKAILALTRPEAAPQPSAVGPTRSD